MQSTVLRHYYRYKGGFGDILDFDLQSSTDHMMKGQGALI